MGGWCVSNPKPLADALRALKRPPVVYPTTVNPPDAFDGLPVAQSLSHFFWKLDMRAAYRLEEELEAAQVREQIALAMPKLMQPSAAPKKTKRRARPEWWKK